MNDIQDIKKAIGDAIRSQRSHLGLTQEDLAASIGVSVRSVQRFEAGRDMPKMSTLFLICEALVCKPQDMIGPAWRDWSRRK